MSDKGKISVRLAPELQAALASRVRPGYRMSDVIREALEAFVGLRPTPAAVSDTMSDTSDILRTLVSDVSDLRQRLERVEDKGMPPAPPVRQARPRPTTRPTGPAVRPTAGPTVQPVRRGPGRPSTLRPQIIDLLRAHPEGLTAVQIKVLLGIEKNIGDTLGGMVKNQVIGKDGSGPTVRYVAVQV